MEVDADGDVQELKGIGVIDGVERQFVVPASIPEDFAFVVSDGLLAADHHAVSDYSVAVSAEHAVAVQ